MIFDRFGKPLPHQQEILDFIGAYIKKYNLAPSVREIGRAFAMKHPNAAQKTIDVLIKKGYLKKVPNKIRGLRIVEDKK